MKEIVSDYRDAIYKAVNEANLFDLYDVLIKIETAIWSRQHECQEFYTSVYGLGYKEVLREKYIVTFLWASMDAWLTSKLIAIVTALLTMKRLIHLGVYLGKVSILIILTIRSCMELMFMAFLTQQDTQE